MQYRACRSHIPPCDAVAVAVAVVGGTCPTLNCQCKCSLETVIDCSSLAYTSIPSCVPANATSLYEIVRSMLLCSELCLSLLQSNAIQMTSALFSRFPALSVLCVTAALGFDFYLLLTDGCVLVRFDVAALHSNISSNGISYIPPPTFTGATSLNELYAS